MGAWQEIVDFTVPNNTTSVTFNNFGTITKDDFIKVFIHYINNNGTDGHLTQLLPNNDLTLSNYFNQAISVNGTSISAGKTNYQQFGSVSFGSARTSQSFVYGKLSENNKWISFSNGIFHVNTSFTEPRSIFNYSTSISDFPNGITSLTWRAIQDGGNLTTNRLSANSRIQIYRLTAEKVADVTVTSNTTQVDITGLDIKKGDEYLLVSDVIQTVSSANRVFYNNDTTTNNYYTQLIRGNGSTAQAARIQEPRIAEGSGNAVNYTHIKLSNIGAYTYQSYSIRAAGTSSLLLENWFGSSTAENITSITQLNITSTSTNGIGSGTRFQLYKLYEGGN